MELKKLPNTDAERINALRIAYQKAITTPKEDLAFSSEMLKYLKPFMTKLYSEMSGESTKGQNQASSVMLRQVIDELLRDIWDEVEITYSSVERSYRNQKLMEYGIVGAQEYSFQYVEKVA